MKNNLVTTTLLVLFALHISAQDIDKLKTTFEYLRLPMKPLNKDIKNYTSKVILGYADALKGDKASAEKKYETDMVDYNKQLAVAQDKYKVDMAEYEVQKKEARDNYDKEMAEWNSKSAGKRLIEKSMLNQTKPQLQMPSQPYMRSPVRPVLVDPESSKIQKMFDTDALASGYLRLEGYNNGKENAVNIIVTMTGFEYNDPVSDVVEKNVYNTSTKSSAIEKTYTYKLSYKHPMSVRLETAKGVVMDEFIEALNNFKISSTTTFKSQYELDGWWEKNKDAYMANLVEKAAIDNLKYIDSVLNSNYGYLKIKRETNVRLVKSKKENYDDFQQAYEAALAGYNLLAETHDKSTALPQIQKAVELWEAAMKESNPSDKKARIDADVTMATIFNLAEACIWNDDYSRASALLVKLNSMDPSKKERKEGEDLAALSKEQKLRYEANR